MYRSGRGKLNDLGEDQDQHLDRWLVSYADYMTLMFALFVVLYSMSMVKEEQYQVLSEALGQVFQTQPSKGNGVVGEGLLLDNDPADTEFKLYGTSLQPIKGPELVDGKAEISNIKKKKLGSPLSSLQSKLNDALFDLVDNGQAKVENDDEWLTIELNSGLLFVSGSASPTHSAQLVLKQINDIIGPVENFIRVRGYTDDQPIRTELYASNWELSVARATAAVRILQQLNINPARMAIEGYGQYSPSADNSTAQGRRKNRSVVIALSKYALEVSENPSPPVKEVDNSNEHEANTGDYDQIQVIELPSGGIRITTRRDPQLPKPANKQNKDR